MTIIGALFSSMQPLISFPSTHIDNLFTDTVSTPLPCFGISDHLVCCVAVEPSANEVTLLGKDNKTL